MLDVISVVIGFFLAFVVLPWLVLPNPRSARNALDRIVINFLRWLALVVVLTEVLAAIHLYETFTIILLCLIGAWYTKLRHHGWTSGGMGRAVNRETNRFMGFLDRRERARWVPWHGALPAGANVTTGDGTLAFTGTTMVGGGGTGTDWAEDTAVTPIRPEERRVWRPRFLRHPRQTALALMLSLPILLVLGEAAYLHFQLPLAHSALTPGDDYVHMTWATEISNNRVFPDGIYPMGMASVLAFVGKLSPAADMAAVTRFMGPIVGTLIILSIFYTGLRLSRSAGGAIFAAGAFGLFGSRADWHEPWPRQIGALPQELALAIMVFTVGIVALAVVSRNRDHLWTVLAGAIAMSMTHPLPVIFFVLLAPAAALAAGMASRSWASAFRVTGVAWLGAALGFAYIPIAWVVGVPFYAGIGGLNPFTGSGTPGAVGNARFAAPAVGYGPLSHWAMLFLVAGFVGALWLLRRRDTRTRGALLLALSSLSAALLVAYNPTFLGLSNFYANRTANIAGPLISLAFAAGIGGFLALFRRIDLKAVSLSLLGGIICLAFFAHYFPNVPRPFQPIEYDSSADVTQQIVDHNVNLTYTMVGLPEQRQRAIGQAYFVEQWVFARDVRLSQAQDPSYQLPIPTSTVYIFTEKQPFPQIRLAPLGATEEYYRDPVKRARIETTTYQWAETYRKYHNDMSVFYDDPLIRVYVIHHVPDPETALHSPQFKDYTWHPGVLFNSGPTNPLEARIP